MFFALEDCLGNIYDVLAGDDSFKEYTVHFGEDTLDADIFCGDLSLLRYNSTEGFFHFFH